MGNELKKLSGSEQLKARREIITPSLTQVKARRTISGLIVEFAPSPGHTKAGLWYPLLIYTRLKLGEMLQNDRVVGMWFGVLMAWGIYQFIFTVRNYLDS